MALDDRTVDGLKIDHTGEAREIALEPGQDARFDCRHRLGVNGPIIEGALDACEPRRVAPPERLAVAQRHVGADVFASEVGHPHMARLECGLVLRERGDHAPAGAHAAHVVDWFREHREAIGCGAVRPVRQTLRLTDQQLVIDPTMARIEVPAGRVVDRHYDVVGAGLVLEVLPPPGVDAEIGHEKVTSQNSGQPRTSVT